MKSLVKAILLVALCLGAVVAFAQESITPQSFIGLRPINAGTCNGDDGVRDCFVFVKDAKAYLLVGAKKNEKKVIWYIFEIQNVQKLATGEELQPEDMKRVYTIGENT